ncbi:venom prothrombin activator omicarin-C catalytic subunit-like [Lepeophtheirus salmonis]|uniref:venom prothrombin activator omicarin-C catalytic subunit-like n=1 Tax=Lepeophtheirus salmonis TaxID=72036 RepID=UPI001AE3AC81|nr:venom prothrombin activator omicarin-C catalytic subunit-like [Lepeophtheirus salmonis]
MNISKFFLFFTFGLGLSDYFAYKRKKYYFNTCDCGVADVKDEASIRTSKHIKNKLDSLTRLSIFRGLHKTKNNSRSSSHRRSRKRKAFNDLKVVNGIAVSTLQIPWQVIIRDSEIGTICGGSVINLRFILTAAHCIEDFKKNSNFPKPLVVIIGNEENCIQSINYHTGIDAIIIHHNYKRIKIRRKTELIYDFALIKTLKPIEFNKFSKPVCLPPKKYRKKKFSDYHATVSGYGAINVSQNGQYMFDCQLRKGFTKINSPRSPLCRKLARYSSDQRRYDTSKRYPQMCAFDVETRVDTCNGDSGGPITVYTTLKDDKTNKNRAVQVGVVSYGSKRCDKGGVYGRITSVLAWIIQRIQIGECHYNKN